MKNAATGLILLLIMVSGCTKDNSEKKLDDILGVYYGTSTKYEGHGRDIYDDDGNLLEIITVYDTSTYQDTVLVTPGQEEGAFKVGSITFEWDGGCDYFEDEGFSGYYSSEWSVHFDPKEEALEQEYSYWFYVTDRPSNTLNRSFYGVKR